MFCTLFPDTDIQSKITMNEIQSQKMCCLSLFSTAWLDHSVFPLVGELFSWWMPYH